MHIEFLVEEISTEQALYHLIRDFPDDESLAMLRSLCLIRVTSFTTIQGLFSKPSAQSRGYGRLKAAIPCKPSSTGTLGGVRHRLIPRLHHVTKLPGHRLRYPVSGTGGGNHNRRMRSRIALNS